MIYLGRLAGLVVLWLLAWGEVSLANVASGVVVGAGLMAAFPPRRHAHARVRPSPVGIAVLLVYIARQLIVANLLVAREIVSPRSRVRTGVIAHRVRHDPEEVVALMANVIALSPGTMTVEVDDDPTVVYVHFLLLQDIDQARRALAHLEDVVARALGGTLREPDAPADPPADPLADPVRKERP